MQFVESCLGSVSRNLEHMDLRLWLPALLVAAVIGIICMRGIGQ